MTAAQATPPSTPLELELREVLANGVQPALDLSLPELEALGKPLVAQGSDAPNYLEAALAVGLNRMGDTPFRRSAECLFGLREDTQTAKLGARQAAAAAEIPISARHFRRPGSYQDRVITALARAMTDSHVSVSTSAGTHRLEQQVTVREAIEADRKFVVSLMDSALRPYYGGDHVAHAERIFDTHIAGGQDRLGFFSTEQRMFIATLGDTDDASQLGMLHIVGKRQGTFKISPLIVHGNVRGRLHVGSTLLSFAEDYAKQQQARQLYCTVARDNRQALQFFVRNGFVIAGSSASHYKPNITELMLYKLLIYADTVDVFDRPNISVLPMEDHHHPQVRELLLAELPGQFEGIDGAWVDALFNGYSRRHEKDINKKYKLIFVAVDRRDRVLGVAGATPKKGEPIKLMPLLASTRPAFTALATDIPFQLRAYGRKLYAHISAGPDETIALQRLGWRLDAALPAAYHEKHVTQQWSIDLDAEDFMRTMRVKQRFLDHIKAGTKPLEVRVGYDSVKTIDAGERIRFASRDDSQVVIVKEVRQYKTFEEMSKAEDLSLIVPGQSATQVMKTLREIYPPDRERLGVYVLHLTPDPHPSPAGQVPAAR